ncbi:IS701 family transposase [Nocardia niigatensis]
MLLLVRALEVARPPRVHVVFVWDTTELAVAAPDSGAVLRWRRQFDELTGRIGARFVRTRRTAARMLTAMMSDLPAKNCWTLPEHCGGRSPDAMQRLLSAAGGDEDGLRDDLRAYVIEHLGDVDATLVVDETGDIKKGVQTVGVQRQYTGTAGRIENSQGQEWSNASESSMRCISPMPPALGTRSSTARPICRSRGRATRTAVSGPVCPADVGFATKPALAKQLIVGALDAGVPAPWVTGDEVYGGDPKLRAALESRGTDYVFGNRLAGRLRPVVAAQRGRIAAVDGDAVEFVDEPIGGR